MFHEKQWEGFHCTFEYDEKLCFRWAIGKKFRKRDAVYMGLFLLLSVQFWIGAFAGEPLPLDILCGLFCALFAVGIAALRCKQAALVKRRICKNGGLFDVTAGGGTLRCTAQEGLVAELRLVESKVEEYQAFFSIYENDEKWILLPVQALNGEQIRTLRDLAAPKESCHRSGSDDARGKEC